MKPFSSYCTEILLLLCAFLIVHSFGLPASTQQSGSILPTNHHRPKELPQTIIHAHEQQQHNYLQQQTNATTQATENQQMQLTKHKSYDIIDDVFENSDDDDHFTVDELFNDNEDLNTISRKKRSFADWFIAPQTKWCGRGNLANGTYKDLGGASEADMCCRKHDHCHLYIPAMSNRYELFNYRPYTLSHCKCDRRFRTCLKMVNDEAANTIGKLFFNMVQTQCFVLKKEKTCTERDKKTLSCTKNEIRPKAFLKNNRKF